MRAALALAILLAASAARAASPVDLTALVGGSYVRADSWTEQGYQGAPTWNLDLAAGAGGGPFNPAVLQWRVDADYHPSQSAILGTTSFTSNIGYQANALALSTSVLPINLYASRRLASYSAEGEAPTTGSSLVTTEGAIVNYRPGDGLPLASIGLRRIDSESHSLAAPVAHSSSTGLDLALVHNPALYNYSLTYSTSWNSSDYFAETNFRSHDFALRGNATPTESTLVRISERYFLRAPTSDAPTNPRVDDSQTGLGVQVLSRDGRANTAVDYAFHRLLVVAPETLDLKSTTHSLTPSEIWRYNQELSLLGNATLGYADQKQGDQARRDLGESVGAGLIFRRLRQGGGDWSATANANAGAVQRDGGPSEPTWGVGAGAGLSGYLGKVRSSANYAGAYQNGGVGLQGWSTTQQLEMTAESYLWAFHYFRGRLSLLWSQREDVLLGSFRNRAATLTLDLSRRNLSGQLNLGITDGLAPALAIPGTTEPLLQARYNTINRYAIVSATALFDRQRLAVTASGRAMWLTSPGRADQTETGASLAAEYILGQVVVTLEDRYSSGSTGDLWSKGNLLWLRISRTFGARF